MKLMPAVSLLTVVARMIDHHLLRLCWPASLPLGQPAGGGGPPLPPPATSSSAVQAFSQRVRRQLIAV